MTFIQIIEYETDRPDEMQALGEARMNEASGPPPFARLAVTQDRDRPNHYMTIVEFSSYEAATANNDDPATQKFAADMAALCTSPPTFHNLDVRMTAP
jgi:quinol monooxygenase YgiN